MMIQNSSELAGVSTEFNPSEAKLRLIIDSIPVIAWCALADGSGEFWNQPWHDYTGLSMEGARGWGWRAAIHPEDLGRIEKKWRADLASGHAGEVEGRLRRFDGEFRWFLFRYEPLREEASDIVNWYGTITDIDDLKRGKEALSANEQNLRLIIDGIPGLVATMSATGKVELVNRHSLEHLGSTTEESNEWVLGNAVHPDDLPAATEALRRVVETGEPLEHEQRVRGSDGVYRWHQLRGLPQRDADGRIVRWHILATDIEDLKEAEQKLRESEEEFQRIADFVAQAIVVLSAEGDALYVNRVARQKTGLTLEDVKARGCYFSLAFHPEDVENFWAQRNAGLSRGEPFELEVRGKRLGQYQWVLLQYNPFRDDQGNIVRWYVTGTEIQRQKAEEERLRIENVALREEIESSMFEEIVGSSEPMRQVITQVSKVAPSDSTVLILGETGTGKELIARALHRRSDRAAKPFIRVNCAAIPQSLIASELFGHEKGAFTGALQRHIGRFESAHGGTIFLDEVGDVPVETQIALLRVLQEREIERVGSHHPIAIDVRLIAATNRDLSAAVASGAFREDLFYRLNVFPIALPALRQRVADIPLLLEYFVGRYAKKAGKKINHINKHTLGLFKAYQWPGNIRELQNVVERGVILSDDDTFSVDESWFKRKPRESSSAPGTLPALADQEVEMITAALAESQGRISGPSGASARLKIPRQRLEYKIRQLGIDKYAYKSRPIK
jgi:formate hydrogenlyase transcriptional activator